MEALDRQFGVTEAGSTVEGEIRAGITTFLTMAYILLVNPAMLSIAGIPFDDALFATAIAAFVGCVVMGLYANLPFALAPGMGLNAYFTFAVVLGMGISWQVALAAVFVEGILFLAMSLPAIPVIGGWRSIMINSIPTDLKIATGAGIGMFLAIIGLREMGWIQDDGATLVNLGATESFTYDHGALIAMVCLIGIAVMMARGINGAIIIGIGVASVWGWATGAYDPYNDYMAGGAGFGSAYADWPSAVVSFVGLPEESLFAATGALGDIGGDVPLGDFMLVMITFLFVDIFDTAGTLVKVAESLKEEGAGRVMAAGIHGVLSGPALSRINDSCVELAFITNTTPIEERIAECEKLRGLSVAGLLGEAIKRIHDNSSVTALFV